MPIIDKCEHCGAEAPLLPTPHGDHCEACYEQVMGPALEDAAQRQCDADED